MKLYTKEQTRIEDNYHLPYGSKNKLRCEHCNDEFIAKQPNAKYCSLRCSNDVYIEKRKIKNAELKNKECLVCNEPLKENANGRNKKYCTNKCKQKAYRNVTK